jgi:hypothetical protein
MKAGLYANIHKKRERISEGSKEKMRSLVRLAPLLMQHLKKQLKLQ